MSAIRITGRLVRDARAMTDTAGKAWMELLLSSTLEGHPRKGQARIMRCMGDGPAAQHACAAEARRFRRGLLATAYANGWLVELSQGAVRLLDVDHVELAATPRDITSGEPAEAPS